MSFAACSNRHFVFNSAWWISGRLDERPRTLTNASSYNTTADLLFSNTTSFLSHPIVRSISSDIVSGQIIASAIVLAFVAIFLLREWIMQNARPGVFEDAEGPPADVLQDAQPLPDAVPPQLPIVEQPPPIPEPATNGHVVQEIDHRPPIDEDEPQPRILKARRVGDRDEDVPFLRELSPHSAHDKGKRVEHRERMAGVVGPVRSARPTKRRRSSLRDSSESPEEEPTHWGTGTEAKPRLDLREEQTQFTFRALSGASESDSDDPPQWDGDNMRSVSPSRKPASFHTSLWDPPSVGADVHEDVQPLRPRSANPDVPEDVTSVVSPIDAPTPVDLHAPRELPSPILASLPPDAILADNKLDAPPSPSLVGFSDTPNVPDESLRLQPASPSVPDTPSGLRRPPLPSVTLPSPSSGIPPSASTSISRGPTPLGSPSLATYSAPEEFEAGPSNLSGYFGRRTSDAEMLEMRAEHDRYFATEEEATEIEDDEEGTERADGPWAGSQENLHIDIPAEQEEGAEGVQQPAGNGLDQPARMVIADMQRMVDEARNLGVRLDDLNQQLDVLQENIDENVEDDMDGALEGQYWPLIHRMMLTPHSYWSKGPPAWRSPECERNPMPRPELPAERECRLR